MFLNYDKCIKSFKMKTKLSSRELTIYAWIWITANIISLHKLYTSETEIMQNNPHLSNKLRFLKPGWSFLSRLKDTYDAEWILLKYSFKISLVYLVLQFIVTEVLRKSAPLLAKYWYTMNSIVFVLSHMGYRHLLLLLSQPLLYASILFSGGQKTAIWILSILILVISNIPEFEHFLYHILNLDEMGIYLVIICTHWIELRCISFCIDYIDRYKGIPVDKSYMDSLVDMLSYNLYLPVLYPGPVMLYEEFEKSFSTPIEKLSVRLKTLLINMLFCLFYIFVMELALHFFYFYAMQEAMELIKMLPPVALAGAGLFMGLQYHMKYVIAYGIPGAFAQLDNIVSPPTPKCIASIHSMQRLWRHFDVGLHNYLLKYIYKPSLRILSNCYYLPEIINKIIASSASFVFVFLWHGTTFNVFVWIFVNYIGVSLENICKCISQTEVYHWFKKSVLKTDAMETRFIGVLGVPLFISSATSNFYLIAGRNIGDWFVECITQFNFRSWSSIYIVVSIYSFCVVSIALEDVPSRTDVKRKTFKKQQEMSPQLYLLEKKKFSAKTVKKAKANKSR